MQTKKELNSGTLKMSDTILVDAYNEYAREIIYEKTDSVILQTNYTLRISKIIQYNKGIAVSLRTIGTCYYLKGELPLAHVYLDSALIFAKKSNDKKVLATIYRNKGNTFTYQGNYTEALNAQLTALKLYESINDAEGIGSTNLNLGSIYTSQKKYPEGVAKYKSALVAMKALNDEAGIGMVLLNLGIIKMYQGHNDSAITNFNEALAIAKKNNDKVSYADIHTKLGIAYKRKSDYDKALYYYNTSITLNEEIGNKKAIAAALSNIANVLTQQKKYAQAEANLIKAITISESNHDVEFLHNHYSVYTELDSAKGDYKNALKHYRMQMQFRDSINNLENAQKQTALQLNYEFEKKTAAAQATQDKKEAVAKVESRRQKIIRNVIAFVLLICIGFMVVFLRQRNRIKKEKKRSDDLLLNILPAQVAEELKNKGKAEAKQFDEVTVMFTDFVGFTSISESMNPKELVEEINFYFTQFDLIIEQHGLEKIKTIGDAYMAVGGLPKPHPQHAQQVIAAALAIVDFVNKQHAAGKKFQIRIGVHSGPVVAGIAGVKKFVYDIWGDTVNTAARMEQNSEAGKINISSSTYAHLKNQYPCQFRGKLQAKNKGALDMYFVEKAKE
ncbi:MAG TPA: adenylate/guanylate cyclase domain-containing protein [Bacteroidia bacterium]|nr:adenylate/guanylate cyclase domain-containing protein [Bacteroidia bacterium]